MTDEVNKKTAELQELHQRELSNLRVEPQTDLKKQLLAKDKEIQSLTDIVNQNLKVLQEQEDSRQHQLKKTRDELLVEFKEKKKARRS